MVLLQPGGIHLKLIKMKQAIFTFTLMTFFALTAFAQSSKEPMKVMGAQIFQGDMPITLGMARDLSMSVSSEAYMHFQKAGKIRGWNIFRGVLGTGETLLGLGSVATGNTLGILDLGIGAGCIVSIFPRENNRKHYIMMGVKAYNASIIEK